MARINLLPWRAERRRLRQREFVVMLAGAAVAAVLLSFLIISYYGAQIDGQNQRNAYLTAEIAKLDVQIKEIDQLDVKMAKLLDRKIAIEKLQADRSQMVHLFDELVKTLPDGVKLASITQSGDELTLDGQAQSNARVSAYMRNLQSSGWMKTPELFVIKAEGDDKSLPYVFKLRVKLDNPNKKDDEATIDAAGDATGAAA